MYLKNQDKTLKFCACCHEFRLLTEFRNHNRYMDGLGVYCSDCRTLPTKVKCVDKKIPPRKRNALLKNKNVTKSCYFCKQYKTLIEFANNKNKFDGLHSECKPCMQDRHLIRKYGMTRAQKNQMRFEQNYKCLICSKHEDELKSELFVDHNHITKKVRGLVCETCNLGLGLLKVDNGIILLTSALNYVKTFNNQGSK